MIKKQILYGGIILAVIILSLLLIFRGGAIDPEKQRYAEFNAKIGCTMFNQDSLDVSSILGDIQQIIEEYDYTQEEISSLKEKYETDKEFMEALEEELKKECPEKVDELDLEEYFDSVQF